LDKTQTIEVGRRRRASKALNPVDSSIFDIVARVRPIK